MANMHNVSSDARTVRGAALLACALALSGCAARPKFGALSPSAIAVEGARDHTILVATTRARDGRPGTLFNGERADALDHAVVTVSVPPSHVAGAIEWPAAPPADPKINFTVRSAEYIDSDKAFAAKLNQQLALRPPGRRQVVVFVHGYNTLFSEALYRLAQVADDSKAPGVPVLFTWASRGQVADYVYDLNSATAARDQLERTLRLIGDSHAEEVAILAHSMGNWVAVEALRQIKITGAPRLARKLGPIVLAAPDIDIDVFKSQMARIGKPQKPLLVVLSKDDRALRVSKFLAGGAERLGADADYADLTKLGASVIDLTDVKGPDSSNHNKFAELAAVAPQLRGVLSGGIGRQIDPDNPTSQGALNDSLSAVVSLPITILGAPVKILRGR